jgi:hypothetical protein
MCARVRASFGVCLRPVFDGECIVVVTSRPCPVLLLSSFLLQLLPGLCAILRT